MIYIFYSSGEEVVIKTRIVSTPHSKNDKYVGRVDEQLGWDYRLVEFTEESVISDCLLKLQKWAKDNNMKYVLDLLMEYGLCKETLK